MSITRLVWYIFFFIFQHREDDVRQLAGYPDYRLLWLHPFPVLDVLCAKTRIPSDGNPCSLYNHRAKQPVAPEGLLAMYGLLSAAVARWYQSEVGGKLLLVVKPFHVTDLSKDRHGNDGADAGDCPEQVVPAPVSYRLAHPAQLARCLQQRAPDDLHLSDKQIERCAGIGHKPHVILQPRDERP